MTITVRVHRKFSSRVNPARLKRIARRATKAERQNGALTVYITTDSEIRLLNRKFHAANTPTDVLSFPSNDHKYLGDIVISHDRARIQARAAGWRVADELDLLAVHGVLHLVGYNDTKPRAKARMWKRQKEILGNKELH